MPGPLGTRDAELLSRLARLESAVDGRQREHDLQVPALCQD